MEDWASHLLENGVSCKWVFMLCLYNSHTHVLVHHEQLNRCCSPYQTDIQLTENLPLFFFQCLPQDPSEALTPYCKSDPRYTASTRGL